MLLAPPPYGYALGLLEVRSIARGIVTCDAMVKKAEVRFLRTEAVSPGKYVILFDGAEADADEAFRAGLAVAKDSLVDSLFLPNPDPQVWKALSNALPRPALDAALASMRHVGEASCEEFIAGEEFTFDTVCIAGKPAYENVAQYLPPALIMRSEESVSPVITTLRDLDQPKIAAGIKLGRGVLDALSMGDGFTHMEWFCKADGEVVFGEIGCRPGGAHIVDQMNYTSDIDLFREWARVSCRGRFEAPTLRKYNAAIIFKRAKGRGRITRITGLVEFMKEHGEHVVEERLLRPGTQRRNWKSTLLSDGHILLRHPDWKTANDLAAIVASEITMHAE